MAVSISSVVSRATRNEQWSNGKHASPELDVGGTPTMTRRSEGILRWKSREATTEEKWGGQQEGVSNAASPASTDPPMPSKAWMRSLQQREAVGARPMSPSRFSKSGPSHARQESLLKRGESVRRRVSVDSNVLQLPSTGSSADRLLESSTRFPSFDELLNQRTSISTAAADGIHPPRSPARSGDVIGIIPSSSSSNSHSFRMSACANVAGAPDQEMRKTVTRTLIRPDENSQDFEARGLLELRSHGSVKLPLDDVEARSRPGTQTVDVSQDKTNSTDLGDDHHQRSRSSEITPADSYNPGSYKYTDLMDTDREMVAPSTVKASKESSRSSDGNLKVNWMVPSPIGGYENVSFFPKNVELRNQIQRAAGHGGESRSATSSPTVLEFNRMLPLFEAFASDSGFGSPHGQGTGEGHESLQVRVRNVFLERLRREKSAEDCSGAATVQTPTRSPSNVTSFRQEQPLSQSARFAGQQIPDLASLRSSGARTTTSKSPHQSLRKVHDSTCRSSGLSISCRRSSIDNDVFYSSTSQLVSLGCRPSISRPRATTSVNKLSSRNTIHERGSHHHICDRTALESERFPRISQSNALQQLFTSESEHSTVGAASSAKSFKTWLSSHFQMGRSKKNKNGLVMMKPSPVSFSPQVLDQKLQEKHDSTNCSESWTVRLPAEYQPGDVAGIQNMDGSVAFALPPPPPRESMSPADSCALNGKDKVSLPKTPRQNNEDEQSADENVDKRSVQHHPDRRASNSSGLEHRPNIRSPMNPSGPLKFQGLQHLFAADVSASTSPEHHSSPRNGPQSDSITYGEPKRTMKFLECAEIAELNQFLRAKRDNITSCQRNGGGYLKFISTRNPTDLGSMICAICYSFFLEKRRKGSGKWSVVPLINFSRWKMEHYLDAAWLFNVCGLDAKSIMFVNEVDFEGLLKAGVTTRTMFVGEQVLEKGEEVGSCCTLLAEIFLKEAPELWARSGSYLKTLLLGGLLMNTENLSKPTSSAVTSRDHQMLLNMVAGSGPLGRFGLYECMRTANSDSKVLKMTKRYYGRAAVRCTEASSPPLPPRPPKARNGAKLSSPKGSPLFSSEADENSRSSGSPTSGSSSSDRSHSNSPANVPPPDKSPTRSLSSLSELPDAADPRNSPLRMSSARNSGLAF